MKIIYREGRWYSTEVFSAAPWEYGTYTFTLASRVDQLDKNIVLGLFTYDDTAPAHNYRKLDIEFSKWGEENGPNSQYVVQPWSHAGNLHPFSITLQTDDSTHAFNWHSSSVQFTSYQGHTPTIGNEIEAWSYYGSDIPPPGWAALESTCGYSMALRRPTDWGPRSSFSGLNSFLSYPNAAYSPCELSGKKIHQFVVSRRDKMSHRILLVLLALGVSVMIVNEQGPTNTPTNTLAPTVAGSLPWGMFQHEMQHTGRSPYPGPQNAGLIWNFPLAGYPGSPAIGSDGTIYLPTGWLNNDTIGYLYAINPNGTQKWRVQLNILPSSTAPAIGPDGTIYIHGGGSEGNIVAIEKMYAINPGGTIKWTFLFNGGNGIFASSIQSSPALAADGTIYVGSIDTNLYALNSDGSIKWAKSPSASSIDSSPAVAPDGTVYIHDQFGLYAYTPSGTKKWNTFINVTGAEGSPSIGADGTVYFAHSGNKVFYAVNPNGTIKWQFTLGSQPRSTPAIAVDGTVYIGADGLYALNPNGTLKWKFPSTTVLFSSMSPIIGADGMIYWRESDYFYAINPDGTQKWKLGVASFPTDGLDSSPAIGTGGTLYLPDASKSLEAFHTTRPTWLPMILK